jgi:2-polyprenyl-3-methyl-5-hydroxy-6-metoxy-1,4-benzoquinol methylase
MSTSDQREPALRQERHARLVLNPSNRLFSRLAPWHIALALTEPLNRLFDPAERLVGPHVKRGQVAADLGCGRGYYTLALAELVGPEGKVYAVDLDEKNIRVLTRKAARRGCRNIEAHASSASDLSFIADRSVDFILANGLL